jgi:streptogramin lyase
MVVFLGGVAQAHAGPIQGTMFYTTFSGGVNIHKVDYNYNGTNSFTLSNNTGLASTPGADGVVFTSDGFLAVGGQGPTVFRVNPTTGAFTSQNTGAGGLNAFHMSVAPNGAIIAANIPGQPVRFNSTLTNNGTPLSFSGGLDSVLDTIVFDKTGQGWYTSSGSGGFGNFGKVNIDFTNNTYTTNRTMSGVPAAHGAAYDPFTDTIVLFGDGHLSQVDPNGSGASLLHDASGFAGTFDQGAVDGQGHIFAANNNGDLTFMDISGSKNVGAPGFVNTQFLAGSLDDVAPLTGLGAPPPSAVPEPASLTMLGIGALSAMGYSWRRRKIAGA